MNARRYFVHVVFHFSCLTYTVTGNSRTAAITAAWRKHPRAKSVEAHLLPRTT